MRPIAGRSGGCEIFCAPGGMAAGDGQSAAGSGGAAPILGVVRARVSPDRAMPSTEHRVGLDEVERGLERLDPLELREAHLGLEAQLGLAHGLEARQRADHELVDPQAREPRDNQLAAVTESRLLEQQQRLLPALLVRGLEPGTVQLGAGHEYGGGTYGETLGIDRKSEHGAGPSKAA